MVRLKITSQDTLSYETSIKITPFIQANGVILQIASIG